MKFFKFLISMILVVAMCVTAVIPASAARVTYYLSDLKLAEADTADEAKQLLKEAGFTVLDKNLNPAGKKAVYMGYKKSTNVDDAITDIRVMNMTGGFNISDYESIFNDALDEYAKEINSMRIAANEFAENYKAGKREALLAYRQLNYYYVEIDKKQVKMGDYMLDFPEKNEDFGDILFKGNANILDNIRILLSMGVADGGNLIDRIKAEAQNPEVFTNLEYHTDAKELAGKIQQFQKMYDETISEIDEINADPDMTDEEKDISTKFLKFSSTILLTFDVILQTIPCGETNYSEYFRTTANVDYSLLYPMVAAMTPGQRAMATAGQLHSVLVYNAVEKSDDELEKELQVLEEDFETLSVYFGTDMNLLDGAIGVTSAALREEAATGNSWIGCLTGDMTYDIGISSLIGVGGFIITGVSAHVLKQQISIANADISLTDDAFELYGCQNSMELHYSVLESGGYTQAQYEAATKGITEKMNAINAKYTVSTAKVVFSSLGLVVGLAMIAFSVYSIIRIVNQYNPKYTEIPTNMVDTVATKNGSRFINYTVVNSLYKDGGKTCEKAGDTNGYDGNQWNAIYYTKSYEAGKCLTSTGYFLTSADDYGKYTPVAGFGNVNCYDLNSYNKNENTDKIFMAFGNSNNKKTAETSVPTVVGSIFAYSGMAISGVAGLGLGMLLMGIIKGKKKTDEE